MGSRGVDLVEDLVVVREEVVFVGSRTLELLEEHWRKGEW